MGLLLTPVKAPAQRQPDRCKCGHAMFLHGARCTIAGCKCRQFKFPTK